MMHCYVLVQVKAPSCSTFSGRLLPLAPKSAAATWPIRRQGRPELMTPMQYAFFPHSPERALCAYSGRRAPAWSSAVAGDSLACALRVHRMPHDFGG